MNHQISLIILFALCVALASAEAVWPMIAFGRERRKHYLANLGLTGLVLAVNLAVGALPATASLWAQSYSVGVCHWASFPGWAVLGLSLLGLDFVAYWAHVGLHRFEAGWRLHRVHHCEPFVDVTTAFRQHPGETIVRTGMTAAGVVLLGVPVWCLAIYLTMSAASALVEHANVRLPARCDRVARWVFVTPTMHKTHHSRHKIETNSNYSNIFSFWDRLCGTYRPLGTMRAGRYGLDQFDDPDGQSLRGLLALPFKQ
jgi:sterol desaturase/sphingolipid hydroxylase (fatty acid hydroxylase superfamily)